MLIDPVIGKLTPDEDGFLEGSIKINHSLVCVYCLRSEGPTEEERTELRYLLENWNDFVKHCDEVLKPYFSREDSLCLDQFIDDREAEEVIKKLEDSYWNLINLESISFPIPDDTKTIDLYFSNFLDLDHGLSLQVDKHKIERVNGIKFRIEKKKFIKSYENGY